jgi:CubicO group peptidase (beta-lactamase class C family)
MKNNVKIQLLLLLTILMAACTVDQEKSQFEKLLDYEGQYEYSNPDSLTLAVSDMDTILYAIIDDAKYPLKYISKDTFETPQKTPLVFQRNGNNEVISYQTDGETFTIKRKTIDAQQWFPRRELYNNEQAYEYKIPNEKADGLQVGDVKSAFKNPEAILDMVKETIRGEFRDVHSILLWKDGKLVLEEYFYGYDEDKPHQLRSASKSFIGTLVGIAIDDGKIKSENELLLPLFRDEYEVINNRDSRKEKITIEDFLTYRHGMDCSDEDPATAGHEQKMLGSNDWVKFTLDLPMVQEPGVKSSYCTGCAQTLGRLVEIATETPLVEYADKNLFGPMGITHYKWRFKPDTTSVSTFNQMYLRPRDILKLAIMYHHQGKWQGQQIVSDEWVQKTFEKEDEEFGYLWRHKYFDVGGKSYHSYLATGNGGQKVNIWPELNMITVFTGGNYNAYLYGRTTPPNEMIPNYVLKALE